jgi:hypothetical protein
MSLDFMEILKYTLPSAIMLIGVYFILQSFFKEDAEKRNFELKKIVVAENRKISLPLRLQAYERVILFLERIHPYSLVQRVREPNMNVTDFHLAMMKAIRMEYEYNLSQQMYISPDSWTMVSTAKEETLKQINAIASGMPENANSIELSKAVLEYFMNTDKPMPIQIAVNFLKDDVKTLF